MDGLNVATFAITNGYNVTYIHTFTNTAKVATFKPSITYKGTSVRLLVVGGGGAGMDGTILTGSNIEIRPGGGGGGGGRVIEMNQLLSWGDEWIVGVGTGGGLPDSHQWRYGYPRTIAGSSFVSNGVVEIAIAQGGGSGGGGKSPHALAGDGAAGGGGSNAGSYDETKNKGGLGLETCRSSVFDENGEVVITEGAPFAGGTGSTSASGAYGGGGGGAGAPGVGKVGGIGLVSYITGSPVVYGSGGGGGGTLRLADGKNNAFSDGGEGGINAGHGGGVFYSENDGIIRLTPATIPIANTGSGGAGGVSIRPNNAKVYVGEEEVDISATTACYATPGADGVVIIRYDAVLDHPKGTVVVFR